MTTARERMLDLSPLPTGNEARAHFLAITQTDGGPGGLAIISGAVASSAVREASAVSASRAATAEKTTTATASLARSASVALCRSVTL